MMAKSIFEEMGGTYRQEGDYLIPNLALPEEDAPRFGKYGRKRLSFLREHKKAYYTGLLLNGKLMAHLNEIDEAAISRMELLTKQMADSQGITEAMKAQNQLAWVGAMNNIRNAVEEIVNMEIIFV